MVARMIPYRAHFRCIARCEGQYPLDEVIYRCPTCGNLLEVVHDMGALKQHSATVAPALLVGAIAGFRREHWRSPHLYLSTVTSVIVVGAYYGLALSRITSSWQDMTAQSWQAPASRQ